MTLNSTCAWRAEHSCGCCSGRLPCGNTKHTDTPSPTRIHPSLHAELYLCITHSAAEDAQAAGAAGLCAVKNIIMPCLLTLSRPLGASAAVSAAPITAMSRAIPGGWGSALGSEGFRLCTCKHPKKVPQKCNKWSLAGLIRGVAP